MKKTLLLSIMLCGSFVYANSQSFNAFFGTDIYAGKPFMTFGGSYIKTIAENTEFEFKASVGLKTREIDSETYADFVIPATLGLNFLFPATRTLEFLIGFGAEPTVSIVAKDNNRFYLGPNIKIGSRIKLHNNLKWIIEAQQSLLIGPPDWVNFKTAVVTGFNFTI